VTFDSFASGERIISASIETGIRSSDQDKQPRVLAVGLFTNRGRSFLATAPTEPKSDSKYSKDNVIFERVEVTHYDGPIGNGTFKGFFGRSDDDAKNEGDIWRLGLIWGCSSRSEANNTEVKPLGLSSIASMVTDSHIAQGGIYEPTNWKADQANYIDRSEIKFNPLYSEPPMMISGIARLDVAAKVVFHVDVRPVAVTQEKATCVVRTLGSPTNRPAMSWLTIPRTDKHIETGAYEFLGDEASSLTGTWRGKDIFIPFARPFSKSPTCLLWLCEAAVTGDSYSAWPGYLSVTTDGVKIQLAQISTNENSIVGMRVGWFAYEPDECPNIQSGSLNFDKEQPKAADRCKFPKEFKTTPAVFIALRYFEAGSSKNLRLGTKVAGIKEDGFDYEVGTWTNDNDHEMKKFGYNWIAVV